MLKTSNILVKFYRNSRHIGPGQFHLPYNKRFDENGNPKEPPHPETPRFPNVHKTINPKGTIAKRIPFKFTCEPNKIYWYCTCGHSHNQPFCDGRHTRLFKSNSAKLGDGKEKDIIFKPIKVQFDKPTEVYFCQCKQTSEPPYCDGTHRNQEVQKAVRIIN